MVQNYATTIIQNLLQNVSNKLQIMSNSSSIGELYSVTCPASLDFVAVNSQAARAKPPKGSLTVSGPSLLIYSTYYPFDLLDVSVSFVWVPSQTHTIMEPVSYIQSWVLG